MLNKIAYEPENRLFEDDFNVSTAKIIGANIKAYKQKEIVKPLIPDKTVTYWGAVITLRLETGDVVNAVWKLDKTVISEHNDVPCRAIMKKRNKKSKSKSKIKESTIPTILRAVGVTEWTELIGTEVRIKSITEYLVFNLGFCISPINENSGRWFYPHYFEELDSLLYEDKKSIDTSKWKLIPKKLTGLNDVLDDDLRANIIDKVVKENRDLDGDIVEFNNRRYFVHVLHGVILDNTETDKRTDGKKDLQNLTKLIDFIHVWMETHEGCISQADQDHFKERFTELYDNQFGREEVNDGHDYGLIKMNKFMEKRSICYKIKVVYATDTSPRYWMIVSHNWSNGSK